MVCACTDRKHLACNDPLGRSPPRSSLRKIRQNNLGRLYLFNFSVRLYSLICCNEPKYGTRRSQTKYSCNSKKGEKGRGREGGRHVLKITGTQEGCAGKGRAVVGKGRKTHTEKTGEASK